MNPFPESQASPSAVFVNWFDDKRANVLPGAYLESAVMLVESVRGSARHPDKYYFVICFLFRHALELYLKQICKLGDELGVIQFSKRKQGTHNLMALWTVAREVIMDVYPHDDQEALRELDQFFERVVECDPRSDGFRYAESRGGDLNLSKLPEIIDFDASADIFIQVCNLLDGMIMGVEDRVQYQRDLRYEEERERF